MTTENFDYENFALSMKEQTDDLLPNDINEENKSFIETTIYNFTYMSGESLCNDKTIDFSTEDKFFICQVIAEWTLHKCVDLEHSAIPKEYWDSILQQIAFTVFEFAKQGIVKNIEQQELLEAIEQSINKTWKKCIEDLSKKNIIPDSAADIAKDLSNIDDMAKRAGENERIAKLERIYNSEDAEKMLKNY